MAEGRWDEGVKAGHLTPGQKVDLCRDRFADPDGDEVEYVYEYVTVSSVRLPDPWTVRVEFENGCTVDFPKDHRLVVADD